MESNHSSLREVLNSIASIQHELVNDQTQMMDSALLGKIKLLAAQLYMEVDIELLSREFPELEFPELDATGVEAVESVVEVEFSSTEIASTDIAPKVETVFEPVVESPVVEEVPVVVVTPVVEVPVVEEVVPVVVEVPLVVEAAPVVEAVPVVVEAPAIVETPTVVEVPVVVVPVVVEVPSVVEAPPVIEMPTPAEPRLEATVENTASFTVNGVIGQMPLSRRFEFSNILFGGDMEKMGLFIQQMIDAPNASARLDVYDHWYEEKQWRRRDESASDMLRMLKRIFAS
jgi:hypothetical protein